MLDKKSKVQKLFNIYDKGWRKNSNKFDAIISSLAIHHLNNNQKQYLFTDIFNMLKNNGIFIMVDIIKHNSGRLNNFSAKLWDDKVKEKSIKRLGNTSAFDEFSRAG